MCHWDLALLSVPARYTAKLGGNLPPNDLLELVNALPALGDIAHYEEMALRIPSSR